MRIPQLITVCLAALALQAPSQAQATRPGGVSPVVFKVVKVSPAQSGLHIPVSYTHLTLPTICSV